VPTIPKVRVLAASGIQGEGDAGGRGVGAGVGTSVVVASGVCTSSSSDHADSKLASAGFGWCSFICSSDRPAASSPPELEQDSSFDKAAAKKITGKVAENFLSNGVSMANLWRMRMR